LITALLIIPAATARRLSQSPERMVLLATLIGMIAVSGGLSMSWFLNSPAGPSIVVSAFLLFVMVYTGVRGHRH
jgi:zinc transport system permease protein